MSQVRLTQFSHGGGCGCKIAPAALRQILGDLPPPADENLLVGNDTSDDAAVYRLNGDTAVISTTDFFMPIIDDPYDFGRIASANALSDVYAMGGTPLMAVAILGWPLEKLPVTMAASVLQGARDICGEASIPLAGGHTIDSGEPIFGLAVTGTVLLKNLRRNSTAKPGDLLFLTKPLGVGIMSTALKRGLLEEQDYPALVSQMTALNSIGEKLGKMPAVHAITDVTGFGLLGHLAEMTTGSGTGAELHYSAIKKTAGLGKYLQQKTIPDATSRNWSSYSSLVTFEKGVDVMEAFNLLPDPQTNGGLLFAADPRGAEEIVALLSANALEGFINPIGRITGKNEKPIQVFP